MIAVLVALGAAVGAPARYATDVVLTRRAGGAFPLGTLTVNVVGSFVLGLVVGAGVHDGLTPSWRALLGIGFCGAFTTYSTFSQECVALLRDGRPRVAALHVLASLVLGLAAAAAGLGLALA